VVAVSATTSPPAKKGNMVPRNRAMFVLNPSITSTIASSGAVTSKNGRRRPIRVRVWSLYVLIMGIRKTQSTLTTPSMISEYHPCFAPRASNCSGTSVGTTPFSIRCRQKSPSSSHVNTCSSCIRVYVSVPPVWSF